MSARGKDVVPVDRIVAVVVSIPFDSPRSEEVQSPARVVAHPRASSSASALVVIETLAVELDLSESSWAVLFGRAGSGYEWSFSWSLSWSGRREEGKDFRNEIGHGLEQADHGTDGEVDVQVVEEGGNLTENTDRVASLECLHKVLHQQAERVCNI